MPCLSFLSRGTDTVYVRVSCGAMPPKRLISGGLDEEAEKNKGDSILPQSNALSSCACLLSISFSLFGVPMVLFIFFQTSFILKRHCCRSHCHSGWCSSQHQPLPQCIQVKGLVCICPHQMATHRAVKKKGTFPLKERVVQKYSICSGYGIR